MPTVSHRRNVVEGPSIRVYDGVRCTFRRGVHQLYFTFAALTEDNQRQIHGATEVINERAAAQ